MNVGHINLAKSFNGTGEHFIALIEALDRHGVKQHVIVQNEAMAKRVAIYAHVSLGPVTAAPVMAYCLMPLVDVVHVHDERGAQSGLLLTLTRSMPFVLTRRRRRMPSANPLTRSLYRRAASVICANKPCADAMLTYDAAVEIDVIDDIARADCADFEMTGNRIAAEHLRVYHRAAETLRVPALLL